MDKSHKQVVTTYPVAIKHGQSRLHVQSPIPWHAHSEYVKCPKCEVVYIVTSGFPKVELLGTLEQQHKNMDMHPDYFSSAPEWTSIADCDCGL